MESLAKLGRFGSAVLPLQPRYLSNLTPPEWTDRADEALVFPFDTADRLATRFGAFALLQGEGWRGRRAQPSLYDQETAIAEHQRNLERLKLD